MLFGICYFVLIQVTNAQVLKGKVIDAGTGSPIPGATVQVHNLFIVAGDSGQFLTRVKPPLNIYEEDCFFTPPSCYGHLVCPGKTSE